MTIEMLFGVFVAAVICAYIPWSERMVRGTNLVLGVVASGLLGLFAYANYAFPSIDGYAQMWNNDSASALVLVGLAVSYLVASVLGYVVFGHEHLHGSFLLSTLRHHAAALPLIGAALTVVAVGNVVWFFPLAMLVLGALWLTVDRTLPVKMTTGSASVLAILGTALIVHAGSAWNTSLWMGQVFTGFGLEGTDTRVLVGGVVLIFASIVVVMGLFPFGLGTGTARGKLLLPFAVLANTAVIATMFIAVLRYRGLASAALGNETWADWAFVAAGLISVLAAVFIAWKAKDIREIIEGVKAWLIGILFFVVALGSAGVIAAALFLLAFVPVMLGLLLARTKREIQFATYLSAALPASSLFIPFVILIGYGIQLRPVLTVAFVVLYTAFVLNLLRWNRRSPDDLVAHRWDVIGVLVTAVIFLNIGLGIALTLPNSIVLAIHAIQTVAGPSF